MDLRHLVLALGLLVVPLPQIGFAQTSPELVQLPVCSARTAADPAIQAFCHVKPLPHGRHEVKINLTPQTATIDVGGYKVLTENYNGDYLTPVVEVMPGDTVAAHLVNRLEPRNHDGTGHGDADMNPTNLHYFHGGIVSPHNAWPSDVELGTGDNVYVHLMANPQAPGPSNTFDFSVPIPGAHQLDARVLEHSGYISHPLGLNWYHSHMHGISSDQVMGGMSGLLSVGEATSNVKAACILSGPVKAKCLNDVDRDTADLRHRTDVRYVLLRDVSLQNIQGRPNEPGHATADWAPTDRNFAPGSHCDPPDANLRLGFCQKTPTTAWLFTLNGQRFPTITVAGNRNALLRIGNVSANIGYWLELNNEADGTNLPLTILSVDGVVPARPLTANQAKQPVQASTLKDLILMPASRVEVYIRNDLVPHTGRQSYLLRTKDLQGIGTDEWPEIQLARIVLEPNAATSKVVSGLNALIATTPPAAPVKVAPAFVPTAAVEVHSTGCVRDLNRAQNEYRRVTFFQASFPSAGEPTWSIKTEIVSATLPAPNPPLIDEQGFKADPTATIQGADGLGVPFEDYVGADHRVDWSKPHVCIEIDRQSHVGSHKQLWVLSNSTSTLHNFHIHQMKFRLATKDELENTYHMALPDAANTCGTDSSGPPQPDIKCYEPASSDIHDPGGSPLWHDTIPLPPGSRVYVIMSFDAREQVGRYVFHCHILKHEDKGLMAPIEVWAPAE